MTSITINVYENDNFFNISNNSHSQIFSAHSGNSGISGNSGLTEPPFSDMAGDFIRLHATPGEADDYQKYYSESSFPSIQMLKGQYETYARIGRDIVNGINSTASELGTKENSSIWKENKQYKPGDTVVAGDGHIYKAIRPTIGEGPWSHTAPESPYAKNDPAWAVVPDSGNTQ
jgi:hypothetical protein